MNLSDIPITSVNMVEKVFYMNYLIYIIVYMTAGLPPSGRGPRPRHYYIVNSVCYFVLFFKSIKIIVVSLKIL